MFFARFYFITGSDLDVYGCIYARFCFHHYTAVTTIEVREMSAYDPPLIIYAHIMLQAHLLFGFYCNEIDTFRLPQISPTVR